MVVVGGVKKKTEEISMRWQGMMQTTGLDVKVYVIENDQVLFNTNHGYHAGEIRDYVVQHPECVAVEWNQQRTPGPAETAEWKKKNEAAKVRRRPRA